MTEITTDNTKAPINALGRIEVLETENAKLKEKYEVLSKEYDKVWDVLRTYNPRDTELEYIGYKTVAVFDAETGEETTCMES